jgi:putative oxidoreductase
VTGIWRLVLRVVVGGLFLGHAAQKLFGWFGGPGLDGAAQGFEGMGLRPGKPHAVAAAAAEAGGGALLAVGAATPVAAALLSGTMLTAIERAHMKRGLWNSKGGFEYNLVLIAALGLLTEAGPGRISVDARRGRVRAGTRWAAAALGTGALGALAVHLLDERELPAALRSVEHRLHEVGDGLRHVVEPQHGRDEQLAA